MFTIWGGGVLVIGEGINVGTTWYNNNKQSAKSQFLSVVWTIPKWVVYGIVWLMDIFPKRYAARFWATCQQQQP